MAKPTDPAKLSAYRARQAQNSANYRARVKAENDGVAPPPQARLKRPANYRQGGIRDDVDRAQAVANTQRQRRAEVVESLPDFRNKKKKRDVTLRAKEITDRALPDRKTYKGRKRQAEAFREIAEGQKIQALGRARKLQLQNELTTGPQAARLNENMSDDQVARFQSLIDRITAGSQQSVALLFTYADGAGDYSGVLDLILGSPESRDVDEALKKLKKLAIYAERANKDYSPSSINPRTGKRVGRITV